MLDLNRTTTALTGRQDRIIMARRASNPPSEHLHDMVATWSRPTAREDSAPGEVTNGGLSYSEMCKLYGVGNDWTDMSVKLPRLDRMEYRAPEFGATCGVCFIQRSVSGACMC